MVLLACFFKKKPVLSKTTSINRLHLPLPPMLQFLWLFKSIATLIGTTLHLALALLPQTLLGLVLLIHADVALNAKSATSRAMKLWTAGNDLTKWIIHLVGLIHRINWLAKQTFLIIIAHLQWLIQIGISIHGQLTTLLQISRR